MENKTGSGLTDREKFDNVMLQKFKPDPPKEPQGIWRVVRFVIFALIFGFILCVLFLH